MGRIEKGRELYKNRFRGQYGLKEPRFLRSLVADFSTLTPYKTDYFAEFEAEIPIAGLLSRYTCLPCFSIEQVSQEYIDGRNVNIVVPVLDSNVRSVIESAKRIRDMGARVEYVMSVVEKEGKAREKLQKEGIWTNSLFTQRDIVVLGKLRR